jgi:lipopolysaccharide/colanic/teichoic acid biosynthesis glycosyltransferase
VLFRQARYGRHKATFEVLKFRTMTGSDSEPCVGQPPDDVRVTAVGRFLRVRGLDELPQLLNVLKGDMSLIGPRPHATTMDDHFEATLPGYARRFEVLPGISGLAQVRGHRGPIGDRASIEKRLESDIEYVERRSLLFDLALLARTGVTFLASLAR